MHQLTFDRLYHTHNSGQVGSADRQVPVGMVAAQNVDACPTEPSVFWAGIAFDKSCSWLVLIAT